MVGPVFALEQDSSNQGETSSLSRERTRLSTNETSGHSNEGGTKVGRGDKWRLAEAENKAAERAAAKRAQNLPLAMRDN
eukprot:2605441-Pleurochrysis_carterae.AAC.1